MAAKQPCRRSTRLWKQKQDWSTTLPPELWYCIGKRLPSRRDAANFRSMCRLWRAALPFTKFAPVLMLPFDPESPDGVVTFYRPTDGKTFTKNNLPALHGKLVCGSSHGWLALVDGAACLTLLNPFTKATVALPPTDVNFVFDSLRPAFMLDGRWVHPSLSDGVFQDVKLHEMRDVFFSEVVLSSAADSGDCIAMALLTESSEVSFCHVGVDVDASWMLLNTGLAHDISCIVHCRNRFLAISYEGQVSICNLVSATPTARPVQDLDLPKQVNPLSYLQVNGELHLLGTVVQGSTYRTQVYKCNVFARRPVWSRVTNAGDLTLLTSHNVAAGHAGGSVSGLKKNSVYYSGHLGRCKYLDRCKHYPNHVLEIINIANGTSEWLPYHQYTHGYPEALCWITPKPWTQGGMLMLETVKDHKGRTSQGCSLMQRGSWMLNFFVQFKI